MKPNLKRAGISLLITLIPANRAFRRDGRPSLGVAREVRWR